MSLSRLSTCQERFQRKFQKLLKGKYGWGQVGQKLDMVDAIQSGYYIYTM